MVRAGSFRASGGYYTRYFTYYAKKNYSLLILSALFLSGVTIGALLIRSAGTDTLGMLLRVVDGSIDSRRGGTVLHNLISSSASSLTFIAVLFVCGFCAVSQPVSVLAPFLRGLGFGFSAASLYANHGASAIGFIAVFILPDMLVSSIAILLCARESLRLSASLWSMMWSGSGKKEMYPFRIYIGRYIAASVLCVFSAFLESVLYFAFANLIILR